MSHRGECSHSNWFAYYLEYSQIELGMEIQLLEGCTFIITSFYSFDEKLFVYSRLFAIK